MRKNKKADRIKFVNAAVQILQQHKMVRQPCNFPVKWRCWEVAEKLQVTLHDEDEHDTLFTVFIRLLDNEKNFKKNGKCNFHDSPGDVDLSIERFRKHFDNLIQE